MNVVLVKKTLDGGERTFPVRAPKTVIGRETLCHIRIALPSVSDQHCEIHIEKNRLHLRDLRSESGTYVNGEQVESATLNHRDEVSIGPVTFIVQFQESAVTPEPKTPSHAPEIVSYNVNPRKASDVAEANARQRGAGA